MPVQFEFSCRACGDCFVVDGHVRDSILDEGCPICKSSATAADFERCEPEEMEPCQ